MVARSEHPALMARRVLRDYAIDLAIGHAIATLARRGWTPQQVRLVKRPMLVMLKEVLPEAYVDAMAESEEVLRTGPRGLAAAAWAMPYLAAGQAVADSLCSGK